MSIGVPLSVTPMGKSAAKQAGSSLNAGAINYALLKQADAMKRLKELESLHPNS